VATSANAILNDINLSVPARCPFWRHILANLAKTPDLPPVRPRNLNRVR
jgi:hypothetical protein